MNINVQLKGASLEPGRCSGGDPGARHHHHLHTGTRVPLSSAANTEIFRPNKYLRWSFLITPDLGHTRRHVSRVHSLAALLRPSLPWSNVIQCYPLLQDVASVYSVDMIRQLSVICLLSTLISASRSLVVKIHLQQAQVIQPVGHSWGAKLYKLNFYLSLENWKISSVYTYTVSQDTL